MDGAHQNREPKTLPFARGGTPRDAEWLRRAKALAQRLDGAPGRIVLIGDSLAARWPIPLQEQDFGRRFVNLGIGGDCAEHVQWRLKFYDLAKARPDAAVLILGTNNLRSDEAAETIHARLAIVIEMIRREIGTAPLFVSEILPRGPKLAFKAAQIAAINASLAAGENLSSYTLLRLHDRFKSICNGQIPCPLLTDGVHLSPRGYEVISHALKSAMAD